MTAIPRVRPVRPRRAVQWLATFLWCALPVYAFAQAGDLPDNAADPAGEFDRPSIQRDWSDEIPAHIAFLDGDATLERDGRAEAAEESTVLLAGDRLRTTRGRAEILFADGSVLDVDEYSDVDLLDDTLIRLHDGRLALLIARGGSNLDYRIDGAGATAWIRGSGEYRVSVGDSRRGTAELRVAVVRGAAELTSPFGRTMVRAGYEAATTAETAPSVPYTASAAAWGAFDRWVDDQYDYRTGSYRSAEYLPADLRYYGGTFDRYGSWEYTQPYGYVWYPTVGINWRPYYDGRWSFVASFGWTWVGGGRWGWPTHHYGRWGLTGGRWFWIPGQSWGPAWVSWASAPGYVSWCPLGYDNRPVISVTNIWVSNSTSWRGWTVLPRRSFSPGVAVRSYAVSTRPAGFSSGTRFAVQRAAPVQPVAIRSTPILRSPTGVARSGGSRSDPAARTATARGSSPVVIRGGQRDDAPRERAWSSSGIRTEAPTASTDSPRARSRTSAPADRDAPRAQPYADRSTGRTPQIERGDSAPSAASTAGRARSRATAPVSGGIPDSPSSRSRADSPASRRPWGSSEPQTSSPGAAGRYRAPARSTPEPAPPVDSGRDASRRPWGRVESSPAPPPDRPAPSSPGYGSSRSTPSSPSPGYGSSRSAPASRDGGPSASRPAPSQGAGPSAGGHSRGGDNSQPSSGPGQGQPQGGGHARRR